MSKIGNFELDRLAEVFKALSNPHRLGIFLRLISCCPLGTRCHHEEAVRQCIGELGKNLRIVPSTLSHHIKELRRAGLIHVERNGKNVECWVDRETVLALADLLTGSNGRIIEEHDSLIAGGLK
jgi:DNA-binding transcriptional ArsR family regulator